MNISLNRQITIEYPLKTQNASGTEAITWTPLAAIGSPAAAVKFWAEVKDVLPSRSEAVTLGVAIGRTLTRIRMRWRDDVTSEMRITVHGDSDRTYQIIAGPAEILGRKQYLEVVAERYTS